MARMRRLTVSMLQCCLSAICSKDSPSARSWNISFSSSVNPHSRIYRSRRTVGNWSFVFFLGVVKSVIDSINLTPAQRVVYLVHKIFRAFVQAVYAAKLFDGCSHVNILLSVYKVFARPLLSSSGADLLCFREQLFTSGAVYRPSSPRRAALSVVRLICADLR